MSWYEIQMKLFGAVFVSRDTSKQNEQKMGMHFLMENKKGGKKMQVRIKSNHFSLQV